MPAPPPPPAHRATRVRRPEVFPQPRPPALDAALATCGLWRAMAARLNEARHCSGSSRRVPRRRHLLAAQTHSHRPPRLRTGRAAGEQAYLCACARQVGVRPGRRPFRSRRVEGGRFWLGRVDGGGHAPSGCTVEECRHQLRIGCPRSALRIPTGDPHGSFTYGARSSDRSFIRFFALQSLH